MCLPFLLPTHEHLEGIDKSTPKVRTPPSFPLSQVKASSRVSPVMSHRLSPVDAIYTVPSRFCTGVVVCCGSTSSNPSSNTTHVQEHNWNSRWVITKCILWLYLDWRPTVFLLWEGVTTTHLTKFGLGALGPEHSLSWHNADMCKLSNDMNHCLGCFNSSGELQSSSVRERDRA